MFDYFLNWFLQIFVPYAFLIIGFMNLKVGRGQDKFEKAFDVGYDACILGFGILAVLLGSKEFGVILKTDKAPMIPLVIGLITLLGFKHLEGSGYGWVAKARVSILAGTLIFGVNTAMIARLDQGAAFPAFFWGTVCFGLPCLVFWLIIGTKAPKTIPPRTSLP